MASACMSLCCVRAGSLAAVIGSAADGRFAVKQAVCTPTHTPTTMAVLALGRLPASSSSFSNINTPCLNARKILGHPAFAFNPSEYKPFSVEELETKNAETDNKPFSGLDDDANPSSKDASSQEQSSEYKPFDVGELEQKITRNTRYKSNRQKHKTVSTTFQPLGPGYPPITLEELEADLAKSQYKPFSRFESKSDATSSKPLGSEYKPFTVEELEQKIGDSSYKPLTRQGGKSVSSAAQPLGSQYKPFTVEELEQKVGESSYDPFSSQGNKPTPSEVKPVDSSYKPFTVEELEQTTGNSTYKPFTNEEAMQSPNIEPSSSSEESTVSSDSGFSEVEPPRLTKVYAGNLPWNYDNQQLEELFKPHGSVFVAEVILDKVTGRSRGFGFVYMNSPEDAEVAIRNLDGKEIGGRQIRVNYQESAEERSKRLARGGGGYGDGNRNANKLFVANLPWTVDDETLGRLFSDYGTVVEARIAYDRDTGRSRGFGFVTLSSADELTNAVATLDGSDYEGRVLKVALAGDKPTSRSSVF
ncbi:hypothetical protein O6H91_02G059300 [Diphasiastrum complanatum]|uniref:Uncharacterized protein n=1 Tax=Diphasiastrum complanatum TaxID=34168 RepID=A0ACC2EFZ3_DIPCM|nr:hypothetical protein O6H91_02G059300 [Diphasiastrum complanatum]